MAENNEMYAEDFEDRVRTIGVLTSGGDVRSESLQAAATRRE